MWIAFLQSFTRQLNLISLWTLKVNQCVIKKMVEVMFWINQSHKISLRSVLINSSHLRACLPRCLFPSDFFYVHFILLSHNYIQATCSTPLTPSVFFNSSIRSANFFYPIRNYVIFSSVLLLYLTSQHFSQCPILRHLNLYRLWYLLYASTRLLGVTTQMARFLKFTAAIFFFLCFTPNHWFLIFFTFVWCFLYKNNGQNILLASLDSVKQGQNFVYCFPTLDVVSALL